MPIPDISKTIAAVFAAAIPVVLLPSIASACEGLAATYYRSAAIAGGVLAAIAPGICALVAAGIFRIIEKRRDLDVERPSWWKTRIWLVGLGGVAMSFVAFLAIGTSSRVVDLVVATELGGPLLMFLATVPVVLQSAYVVRTWQKQRSDSEIRPTSTSSMEIATRFVQPRDPLARIAATTLVGLLCFVVFSPVTFDPVTGDEIIKMLIGVAAVTAIYSGGTALVNVGLFRVLTAITPIDFEPPKGWEYSVWIVGMLPGIPGVIAGVLLLDYLGLSGLLLFVLAVPVAFQWTYIGLIWLLQRLSPAGGDEPPTP